MKGKVKWASYKGALDRKKWRKLFSEIRWERVRQCRLGTKYLWKKFLKNGYKICTRKYKLFSMQDTNTTMTKQ